MGTEQADLTFLQKNIVAMLRARGGAMKRADLNRSIFRSWKIKPEVRQEWLEAYNSLLIEKIIHEYFEASTKRRNTSVAMVKLSQADLPYYTFLPYGYQKKRAENKAWQTEGWQACLDSTARQSFTTEAEKLYSDRWRRHRDNWRQGWDEAQAFKEMKQ